VCWCCALPWAGGWCGRGGTGSDVALRITACSYPTGDIWLLSRTRKKRENASNFGVLFEQSWVREIPNWILCIPV